MKPPWRKRKERYLFDLESLLAHWQVHEDLRSRFGEGPEHPLRYYHSSVDVPINRLPGAMTDEFEPVVNELGAELAHSMLKNPGG